VLVILVAIIRAVVRLRSVSLTRRLVTEEKGCIAFWTVYTFDFAEPLVFLRVVRHEIGVALVCETVQNKCQQ